MHRWPQHSQDESGSLSDQSLCIVFSAPAPGDLAAEDQGPAQVTRGAAAAADPPSSSIGQQQQPPSQQAALWRQISAHESVLELPNSLPAQQAGTCSSPRVQATKQAEQPAQSSGRGAAGAGADTACPQQRAGPLEFQRQELAAASLASSASSVSLLSQQLLPGSASLPGPIISSLPRGCDPSSAGSGSLAAHPEPVKAPQPRHADAATSQQAAAQVVLHQESSGSLDSHRADQASGGAKQSEHSCQHDLQYMHPSAGSSAQHRLAPHKQATAVFSAGPDSLGGSTGSHQYKPPLGGPAHAVEVRAARSGTVLVRTAPFCSALLTSDDCLQGDGRGHGDASAVVLGSWADRVTHLSLHYDSTAAAAARRMLRQRAAAARVQVAPALPPATLRHMSSAGSVDLGQGPSFSPFAEAVEALSSSERSSSRGSPAASLPVGPNNRQAAGMARRWSTGEPVCRPRPDGNVLRWRADFVRWAQIDALLLVHRWHLGNR